MAALNEIATSKTAFSDATMDEFIKMIQKIPGNKWNMQLVTYFDNPDEYQPHTNVKEEDIQIISLYDQHITETKEYACIHYVPADISKEHLERIYVYSVKPIKKLRKKQVTILFNHLYPHIRADYESNDRNDLIQFMEVKNVPETIYRSSNGLFAIAYAISIMNREKPDKIKYEYGDVNDPFLDFTMRRILLEMLDMKDIKSFPGKRDFESEMIDVNPIRTHQPNPKLRRMETKEYEKTEEEIKEEEQQQRKQEFKDAFDKATER